MMSLSRIDHCILSSRASSLGVRIVQFLAPLCTDFWNEIAQEIENFYIEENSFVDESSVFNGLSSVQVQKPEMGTPVISDL